MAFFERTDERDKLVICNICNVKCSERSMTSHRMKCSDRHSQKFKSGLLVRCTYDSGHIFAAGELDDHLEFCTKRQNNLVADFQRESRLADNHSSGILDEPDTLSKSRQRSRAGADVGDDWNKEADQNPFCYKLSKLRIS